MVGYRISIIRNRPDGDTAALKVNLSYPSPPSPDGSYIIILQFYNLCPLGFDGGPG